MRKKKRKKARLRKTHHTTGEFYQLCADFGFICVICKSEVGFYELTRDHIIPTSRGGSDYIWNIQPTCELCNSEKGNLSIDFRPFIPSWITSSLKRHRKHNRK
jgi:5-methylcytosine-specific restriction endonuclease McrA